MNLHNKKCIPCEGGTPPLSAKQIVSYQSQLKTPWTLDEEKKRIKREFQFKNFKESMAFVNKIADIAGQENHHPSIKIFYNRVILELTTHAIGGLSENDFIMASKIEGLTL